MNDQIQRHSYLRGTPQGSWRLTAGVLRHCCSLVIRIRNTSQLRADRTAGSCSAAEFRHWSPLGPMAEGRWILRAAGFPGSAGRSRGAIRSRRASRQPQPNIRARGLCKPQYNAQRLYWHY